jgi:general secretion pathway protein J
MRRNSDRSDFRLGRLASGAARGFTLLELMVAVAILGLVMAMVAESFHAVASSKEHAEGRLAIDEAARLVMFQLGNELRGAVQTPFTPSRVMLLGQAHEQNFQPMDTITFSTLDPGHSRYIEGFGPEVTLAYTTAPNPDHRGWYLLERTEFSSLLTNPPTGRAANTVILADDVLSLHIRYFDGDSWSESWDSTQMPPGRMLPMEITIDLRVASTGGQPLALSTAVAPPMAYSQW